MKVLPSDGGCWFCHNDEGEMYFSFEFDCYVHEECIIKNLKNNNPEAKIMAREFNLKV